MTKQEEIRLVIEAEVERIIKHFTPPSYRVNRGDIARGATNILNSLHSQGVVIKKEFVPPYLPSVLEKERQDLAIVEPLVKEA